VKLGFGKAAKEHRIEPMSQSGFVAGGGYVNVIRTRKPITHRLLLWTLAIFGLSALGLLGYALTLLLADSFNGLSNVVVFSIAGVPPSALAIVTLFFAIFEKRTEEVVARVSNYDPHNLY
jgi:hypothetical protein